MTGDRWQVVIICFTRNNLLWRNYFFEFTECFIFKQRSSMASSSSSFFFFLFTFSFDRHRHRVFYQTQPSFIGENKKKMRAPGLRRKCFSFWSLSHFSGLCYVAESHTSHRDNFACCGSSEEAGYEGGRGRQGEAGRGSSLAVGSSSDEKLELVSRTFF